MATSPYTSTSNALLAGFIPPPAWMHRGTQETGPAAASTDTGFDTAYPVLQDAAASATVAVLPLDAATRERVLLEHMSIVRFVARRIHERLPQHVELEDLVSAGVVGLIDAFQKFDARKNVQFRSYAQFRIRGAILDSLRVLDWGPRDLRRKGRGIEDATQLLTRQLGRRPSENELAAELGISLKSYQQLLGELKGLEISSLNETRCEDSLEADIAYVPAAPEEDPLFRCMQGQMLERLAVAVTSLPEREAAVLSLYYVEEMTMKEIGAKLGVVESRVSQIHSAALVMLRHRLTHSRSVARKPAAQRAKACGQPSPQDSRVSRKPAMIPSGLLARKASTSAARSGRWTANL